MSNIDEQLAVPTVSTGDYEIPKHENWIEINREFLIDYDEVVKQAELKASLQTAVNMQVQWKQERTGHTLSTKAEDWKTELDHFDEFTTKFIAQLQSEVSDE